MAELKTKPNDGDVRKFLDSIEDEQKRKDAYRLLELMQELSGHDPQMWGPSIVGFGTYHYVYKSGREGDWFKIGFSPRKQNLSLYLMSGFSGTEELLERLGKHSTGVGCLYLKRLADVDETILKELIQKALDNLGEVGQ